MSDVHSGVSVKWLRGVRAAEHKASAGTLSKAPASKGLGGVE